MSHPLFSLTSIMKNTRCCWPGCVPAAARRNAKKNLNTHVVAWRGRTGDVTLGRSRPLLAFLRSNPELGYLERAAMTSASSPFSPAKKQDKIMISLMRRAHTE